MIFNHFLKLVLISLLVSYSKQADATSSEVIELGDLTLNEFLASNENVLLEFYSEGCPHCEEFEPTYNEVARRVKSSGMNVRIVRVDGNKNEQSSSEWGIQGFPTIKFVRLRNNSKLEYSGERNVDTIMRYLDGKLNRKVLPLSDFAHLKQLEQEKNVFILFCAANTTYPDIFAQVDKVMSQYDDLELFYSDNSEVVNGLSCNSQNKPDVVIVKKFDDGNLKYDYEGTFNSTHFEEWINLYTKPAVFELTNENIQLSMSNQIPTVFLIVGNASEATTQLQVMFTKHAKLNKVFYIIKLEKYHVYRCKIRK